MYFFFNFSLENLARIVRVFVCIQFVASRSSRTQKKKITKMHYHAVIMSAHPTKAKNYCVENKTKQALNLKKKTTKSKSNVS